jgi:hypothetical protein
LSVATRRRTIHSELAEIIARLDRQILSAEARAADAQAELARLKAEREALSTALRTMQDRPPPLGTPSAGPWPELGRADAVARVLREEAGRELSPQDISVALGRAGRQGDRPALVSAALNYLAKRGRAHSPRHGLWRAGPADLHGPGPPPAINDPTADYDQTGEPVPDDDQQAEERFRQAHLPSRSQFFPENPSG